MSDTTTTVLVKYDVDEAALALVREKCATMTADTPAGYEEIRLSIGHLRDTRVGVEKRRVELKKDALNYGRAVDAEAARLTTLVADIEDPLKAKKQAVDTEKARIKAEEDAAKLKAIQDEIDANNAAKEAAAKAIRDAEEVRLAAEREALEVERQKMAAAHAEFEARQKAEQDRLNAERQAEQARIDQERAKLAEDRRVEEERARAERERVEIEQRVERDRIEMERRKLQAEKDAVDRVEFERQAKIRAEHEAVEKIERDRIEKAQREAELAALLPDLDKILAFARDVALVPVPRLKSKRWMSVVDAARGDIIRTVELLVAQVKRAKGGK